MLAVVMLGPLAFMLLLELPALAAGAVVGLGLGYVAAETRGRQTARRPETRLGSNCVEC